MYYPGINKREDKLMITFSYKHESILIAVSLSKINIYHYKSTGIVQGQWVVQKRNVIIVF